MHPAAGTCPYKSEEVTSPQKSPGATSNPPLLGHDFLLLNNDGLLDRDRVGGFPLCCFVFKQKGVLGLVGAWLRFSMGDQVIPTNDTLRENAGELGNWWAAGWCRNACVGNVFTVRRAASPPHRQSAELDGRGCGEIKNANPYVSFFFVARN